MFRILLLKSLQKAVLEDIPEYPINSNQFLLEVLFFQENASGNWPRYNGHPIIDTYWGAYCGLAKGAQLSETWQLEID